MRKMTNLPDFEGILIKRLDVFWQYRNVSDGIASHVDRRDKKSTLSEKSSVTYFSATAIKDKKA